MRVIFTGDPTELERAEGLSRVSTELYGVKFPMSAEVDVSHLPPTLQRKLMNNPHFRPADIDSPPVSGLIIPATTSSRDAETTIDDDEAAAVAAHKERAAAKRAAKAQKAE